MKIEIPEHTKFELKFIYVDDEKAWVQSIEQIVAEIAHITWLQRYHNTPDEIAPCEHRWLKKQQDGSYKCEVCDKVIKIEEEIPF